MKPCNQTKNWCTALKGYTLPKYALYGNVSGYLYYCVDVPATRYIHVYAPTVRNSRPHWERWKTVDFPEIAHYIEKFKKSPDFVAQAVIPSTHKVREAAELAAVAEKIEMCRAIKAAKREARERREFLRDAGAPTRKTTPQPMYKTTAYQIKGHDQRGFDAEVYCKEENPAPMPPREGIEAQFARFDGMPELQKDGMKTSFKDYHVQNAAKAARKHDAPFGANGRTVCGKRGGLSAIVTVRDEKGKISRMVEKNAITGETTIIR